MRWHPWQGCLETTLEVAATDDGLVSLNIIHKCSEEVIGRVVYGPPSALKVAEAIIKEAGNANAH